jgi:hypothetical protein
MEEKKLVKEDINFLEYPNWILNHKEKICTWILEKDHGRYEIACIKGLPTHFDKVILYFMLYELFKKKDDSLEITTTRYEIAKSISTQAGKLGGKDFERIMLSLKRWESTSISFEGIFYEGDRYTIRYFHVLDDIIFDPETKKLYIKFNQQYVKQIKESKFYKLIDFEEYKKLSRSVSARLYEILVKAFKDRDSWYIELGNLAEKLTIEKRKNIQKYYPSDVIALLKPALTEINKKTTLKIEFSYNKTTHVCVFKKFIGTIQDKLEKTALVAHKDQLLIDLLEQYGLSINKINRLIKDYSSEKIMHKINLLKHNKRAVNNIAAWLIKAIEEDWNAEDWNKELVLKKEKAALFRERKQKEEEEKKLETFKTEYTVYKNKKAQETFKQLPQAVQEYFTEEFEQWLKAYGSGPLSKQQCYEAFLATKLLSKEEQNFDSWLNKQNVIINTRIVRDVSKKIREISDDR